MNELCCLVTFSGRQLKVGGISFLKKEAKVKKKGKAFAKPQLRAEKRAWD